MCFKLLQRLPFQWRRTGLLSFSDALQKMTLHFFLLSAYTLIDLKLNCITFYWLIYVIKLLANVLRLALSLLILVKNQYSPEPIQLLYAHFSHLNIVHQIKIGRNNYSQCVWKYLNIYKSHIFHFSIFRQRRSIKQPTNCSLLGTEKIRGQISEHISAQNGDYCLYSIS